MNAEDANARNQRLVDRLRESAVLRTGAVEAAFRAVPRHLFLPGLPLDAVYRDDAIITKREGGRGISSSSQPAMMAIMLEQLDLRPGQRVLEIGAGTGYNAALLAHLVGEGGVVTTVDIDEDLVAAARAHLAAAGLGRVQVTCADGGLGYLPGAPYDRIILAVGAWDVLPAWIEQLEPAGRIVLPLGLRGPQLAIAFDRAADHLTSASVVGCGFMPLRGAFAGPLASVHVPSDPAVYLTVEDASVVDPDAVSRLLARPVLERPTDVAARPREVGGLSLWLAAHEPSFCGVFAESAAPQEAFASFLVADGQARSTVGLVERDGLALLGWETETSLARGAGAGDLLNLHVRGFGAGSELTDRLVHGVQSWHAAGRPPIEWLRVRAYPLDTQGATPPGELVITRRWSRFVLNWR